MTDQIRRSGRVMPFARRWHVIDEIDLAGLIGAQCGRAALCDRLEGVADALPALPREEELDALCGALTEMMSRDAPDEPTILETMLLNERADALTIAILDHVRARGAADAAMAQELIAMLRPPSPDHRPSPDAMGYMLRCFFSGCRRAIDFEQLAILALAAHRLTPAARALLTCRLSARPLA